MYDDEEYDDGVDYFVFEECHNDRHPDDHWYRTPLCQKIVTTEWNRTPHVCGEDDWVFAHNDIVNLDYMHEKHPLEPGDPLTEENTRRRNDCRGYIDHSWETEWRVAGPLDPLDGEQLYWSNEQGWVDKASADVWTSRDDNLPDEGRWEQGEYTRHKNEKCACLCHWGQYYVNVYEIDRGYGGPEEGGWWYDCGTPVATVPFDTLREAEAFADVMEKRFPHDHSSNSVIYSGGDYSVRIERGFAKPYPSRTPRYE